MATKFKVGDWVRDKSSKFVIRAYHDMIYDNFEQWQPKKGEWCWFWKQGFIPWIGRFKGMLGDEFSSYYEENVINYSTQCEPFIGELPTWIDNLQ